MKLLIGRAEVAISFVWAGQLSYSVALLSYLAVYLYVKPSYRDGRTVLFYLSGWMQQLHASLDVILLTVDSWGCSCDVG